MANGPSGVSLSANTPPNAPPPSRRVLSEIPPRRDYANHLARGILAEGAIALSVTPSGGALFAS